MKTIEITYNDTDLTVDYYWTAHEPATGFKGGADIDTIKHSDTGADLTDLLLQNDVADTEITEMVEARHESYGKSVANDLRGMFEKMNPFQQLDDLTILKKGK